MLLGSRSLVTYCLLYMPVLFGSELGRRLACMHEHHCHDRRSRNPNTAHKLVLF